MRKLWHVLTWSPVKGWEATAFRLLWSIAVVIILLGWADDTVHFDQAVTDDDVHVEKEPNWNADLRLGDGRCLVISTRAVVEC